MTGPDGGAPSVDVLVVGAGRAGLEAAERTARGGETVLCVERLGEPGSKLRTAAEAGDPDARRERDALRPFDPARFSEERAAEASEAKESGIS